MFPVVFSLLLLAVLNQESTAENNTGTNFLVVFPENIAYYYPTPASNKIYVTGLRDFTHVQIKSNARADSSRKGVINSGEIMEADFPEHSELNKSSLTANTYEVISNESITVQALSVKNSSVQSVLVLPTEKLGINYLIPPTPSISGTNEPESIVTESVTERAPFKIIIINSGAPNGVTVSGAANVQHTLQAFESVQIYLDSTKGLKSVTAQTPVAVLFGHTCATLYNCTCGMLLTPLVPTPTESLVYFIPPQMAMNAADKTFVLKAEAGSTNVDSFQENSPQVAIQGPAFLYRPGMIMNLIPEAEFGSCYAVNVISGIENHAIIVAKNHETSRIHIGSASAAGETWTPLEGTPYSSAWVTLSTSVFIWHENSSMAVYYVGINGSTTFGNPAGLISKIPDFRGCAILPEMVEIGNTSAGWRESYQYCQGKEMELISISTTEHQQQIYTKLLEGKSQNMQSVWVGMRRSTLNGEWYWLSEDPVNSTNWRPGAPGLWNGGQCVSVSLEAGQNFTWSDTECCTPVHPVCYSKPVLLSPEMSNWSEQWI